MGKVMKTVDKINRTVKKLPERSQEEVLDFVEFLLSKAENIEDYTYDTQNWNKFSLNAAMRGIEDNDMPNYSESDIKEKSAK